MAVRNLSTFSNSVEHFFTGSFQSRENIFVFINIGVPGKNMQICPQDSNREAQIPFFHSVYHLEKFLFAIRVSFSVPLKYIKIALANTNRLI